MKHDTWTRSGKPANEWASHDWDVTFYGDRPGIVHVFASDGCSGAAELSKSEAVALVEALTAAIELMS